MSYEYLDDIATADVAFRATGASLEELFKAAAAATTNVMIENLDSIRPETVRNFKRKEISVELLLFHYLQEIIFLKDAEQLLLLPKNISIEKARAQFNLKAEFTGERIDTKRHHMNVDVKAVTFHQFKVTETPRGWQALVVLDI